MTVSRLIRGSVIAAALLSSMAHAEEEAVARIGVLMPLGGDGVFEVALAEGLSALGYVEGKNLASTGEGTNNLARPCDPPRQSSCNREWT